MNSEDGECVGGQREGSQYGSLRLSPTQPSLVAAPLIQMPADIQYILAFSVHVFALMR